MTTTTRRLGRTDLEITPIGLGCMPFGGPGLVNRYYAALDQPTATAIVRTALDGGVTWFDTAEMYGKGHSERTLTTALHQLGAGTDDVVIASKWTPWFRTAASIGRTVDDRLEALQGFPLGLHQIHMPHGSLSPLASQLRAMAGLHRQGRIRAVGVSNFSAAQMKRAHAVLAEYGIPLASNQVQISLLERRVERDGVLAAARRLGVTLIALAPLHTGLLTGKFHDDPGLFRDVRRIRRRLAGFSSATLARTAPLIDELRTIAAAHGATVSQVALAWVTSYYGDTVVAIPGASKPRHAEESAGTMALRLTERELDRLADISMIIQDRPRHDGVDPG
ncbi:aldo/keto reductase [Jiangella rhizosphaerae]|uniref:Aldo/keto reductase n=1 Tax=Jiangella rhizosphaerae TaxID=2293569 RepID=A0A418KNQ5_9ACTN|nr:aldo/keto reductase [Jiangella rhizosphaerae]RIQ20589.1 aldo/keto reductase [Jiangella rhizosphaerae]